MNRPQPLPIPDEVEALATEAERYLSGEADAEALARLEALLRSDPEARERFVTYAQLHARLGEIGRRTAAGEVNTARLLAVGPAPSRESTPARARPRRWPVVAAAVAAVMVLGLSVLLLAHAMRHSQALVPAVVAVRGSVEVLREGRRFAAINGQRLHPGDRIVVAADAGLDLVLAGGRCALGSRSEAVVEVHDDFLRRIVLVAGSMDADLASREVFAVRTAAATISLADAAAAIDVSAARTAVAVRRGSVTVRALAGGDVQIRAGSRWSSEAPAVVAGRAQTAGPGG